MLRAGTMNMTEGKPLVHRSGMQSFLGRIIVMGPGLARPCRCGDRLTLRYRDPETLRDLQVAGILADGTPLERGKVYQVWHNPLNGGVAYVADEDGRYLGEAPVMAAARIDDREAIEKHLRLRQRAIAAESRGLRPYVAMRQAEAAETARHNAEVLLGRDPAEDAALADAAREEVVSADAADYVPPEEAEEAAADVDAALAGSVPGEVAVEFAHY